MAAVAMRDLQAVVHELRASVTTLRLLVEGINDGLVQAAPGSAHATEMLAHARALSELVGRLDEHAGGAA